MTKKEIKETIPEQIICSAIHFNDNKEHEHQPINIDAGFVVCGFRHCNCYMTAGTLDKERTYKSLWYEEGFLTNKNRFVDRKEGMIIAKSQNQLHWESQKDDELYSEDIY